jgi:hypothetical protein
MNVQRMITELCSGRRNPKAASELISQTHSVKEIRHKGWHMADAVHRRQRALDCARRAAESTNEEERSLLFEMSEAWTKLAFVEADVTKQAAAEWTLRTLH